MCSGRRRMRWRRPFLEDLALRDTPEFDLWLLGERARTQQLYERGAPALNVPAMVGFVWFVWYWRLATFGG